MNGIRVGLVLVALASTFAGTAAAQQKKPCFATVVGPDGAPLAGAEVTCVFTPDLASPWPLDVVTATTDKRGRARCDLAVGRIYTAWAVGPSDERGARWVTAPADLIAAGRVVELRAIEHVSTRSVQLVALEPWREFGASGLRWFPDARHDASVDLPLPAGDVLELPPSPCTTGSLALLDADGQPLDATPVSPAAKGLWPLAAPLVVDVDVTDDQGRPLGGVAIDHPVQRRAPTQLLMRPAMRPLMRCCGATDAAGHLRAVLPLPRYQGPVPVPVDEQGWPMPEWENAPPLFVRKQGFVPTACAIDRNAAAVARLRPGEQIAVHVSTDGIGVEAVSASTYYALRAGSSHQAGLLAIDTARTSNSTWTLDAQADGIWPHVALAATTPALLITEFMAAPGREVAIDLSEFATRTIRVVDEGGSPIACAIGIVRSLGGDVTGWEGELATDVGGAATVHLPTAGGFMVYATTGTAHAFARLDTTTARSDPVLVRLEPLPTMRVVALDVAGEPVAGAQVTGNGSILHAQSRDEPGRSLDWIASQLWWTCARVSTDANGIALVPALVRPGLLARIEVRFGGRCSRALPLVPDGGAEVTLRE